MMINRNNIAYIDYCYNVNKIFNQLSKKTINQLFLSVLMNIGNNDISNIFSQNEINKNKVRIEDNKIKASCFQQIQSFVNNYKVQQMRRVQPDSRLIGDFRNAEEDDTIINDEIVPTRDYDFFDLIHNLEKNVNIHHTFMKNLKDGVDLKINSIQQARIRIISDAGSTILPVTYEIHCPEHNTSKVFSNKDTAMHIKCRGPTWDEHVLKSNSKNTIIKENRELYGYDIEYKTEKGWQNSDVIFYSLEPIEESEVIIQFIVVKKEVSKAVQALPIILSYKTITTKEKIDNIIRPDKEKYGNAVENLYQNIKDYFQNNLDTIIYDYNKVIAKYMIFILLSNTLFKQKFYMQCLGESGSGKTFWAKKLMPLFTLKYAKTYAPVMSKNKFLGGHSLKKNMFGAQLIEKGLAGSKDVVLCDECAWSINNYHNILKEEPNNVYYMLKTTSDEEVAETTQGTRPYKSKASVMLLGNLDEVDVVKKYRRKVAKEYAKISKKNYNYSWPLFMPLKYYSDKVGDEDLADSHNKIRNHYDEYKNMIDYITLLKKPEISRFAFYVIIEEEYNKQEIGEFFALNNNVESIHHLQFTEELKEILKNEYTKDDWAKFKAEVYDFVKDEYLNSDQQNIRRSKVDLNTHLKINLLEIAYCYFKLQKLFYKEELKLTKEDKINFYTFMSYNYNTLTPRMAMEIEKPYYNNYFDTTEQKFNEFVRQDIKDDEELLLSSKKEVNENELSDKKVEKNDNDLANDLDFWGVE